MTLRIEWIDKGQTSTKCREYCYQRTTAINPNGITNRIYAAQLCKIVNQTSFYVKEQASQLTFSPHLLWCFVMGNLKYNVTLLSVTPTAWCKLMCFTNISEHHLCAAQSIEKKTYLYKNFNDLWRRRALVSPRQTDYNRVSCLSPCRGACKTSIRLNSTIKASKT